MDALLQTMYEQLGRMRTLELRHKGKLNVQGEVLLQRCMDERIGVILMLDDSLWLEKGDCNDNLPTEV